MLIVTLVYLALGCLVAVICLPAADLDTAEVSLFENPISRNKAFIVVLITTILIWPWVVIMMRKRLSR